MVERNQEAEEKQENVNGEQFSVCPQKKLEIALENRKLELGFLWQRSAAFWLFNVAALIAFQHFSSKDNIVMTTAVCCFGMVASFTWSLLNRGSKFWYEHWEEKIFEYDELEDWFNPNFDFESTPKRSKNSSRLSQNWFSTRFSPSKLLISFSDSVFLFWLGVAVIPLIGMSFCNDSKWCKEIPTWQICFSWALVGITLVWGVTIFCLTKPKQ